MNPNKNFAALAAGIALGALSLSDVFGLRVARPISRNRKADPVKKKKRKAQRLARRVNRGKRKGL